MARSLTAARLPVGGQIQQAAERLERNFVDSRQLKVCATCFDLSVSLLRVLEMTITLVPEIFLDWAQPTSEMLLRRLAQVRVSGEVDGTLAPSSKPAHPPAGPAFTAAEPGAEPRDG